MITERRLVTSRPSVYGNLIAPNRTSQYFPPISTEGLYVYIDPSNPHSYIGTGNSVSNLGIGTQALSKGSGTSWQNFYGGSWYNGGATPTGVYVGSDSAIDPSANNVTLFLWVYTLTVAGTGSRVYWVKGATPAGSSWRVGVSVGTDGGMGLVAGNVYSASSYPPVVNRWACFMYTRNGSTHTAYVDNGYSVSVNYALTSSADSWAFGTGNYFSSLTAISGYMGIGAIYNRLFTANERYEWYEATRQRYLV